MEVRLTKFQREEIRYKLDIMEEGFDDNGDVQKGYMAHSYGFKRHEELMAMREKLSVKVNAPTLFVDIDVREAHTAWGELENLWDIAKDNAEYYDPTCEYARAVSKLKQGMDRIEAAFPNEEFK